MRDRESNYISEAQRKARAKRCATYVAKVRKVRAEWREGERFEIPPHQDRYQQKDPGMAGTFIAVTCDAEKTTFPYMVTVKEEGGKERSIGLSRFADWAKKVGG